MAEHLVMTGLLDGEVVEIFQRSAVTLNPALGMLPMQAATEVVYVVAGPDWPKVRIRARRGFARFAYRWGRRPGLMLHDERFNAAFRIYCDDAEFPSLLLNPGLQSFLLEKTTVDWSAGGGAIKLFYRGRLRKNRVDRSIERLGKFRSLIDDELFSIWDSAG